MIDWRAAVTRFPGLGSSVRGARRGVRFTWRLRLARLDARFPRSAAADVPWTWLDAGRALLWAGALTLGGVLGLFLFRLLLSLLFALAEATARLHPGSYQALARAIQPYSAAGTLLLVGGMLCCAVLYGIYRTVVRVYHLSWSALYFRNAGQRAYTMVALLFIPLCLGGVMITQLESRALHAPLRNPLLALLMRGVPALPLNVVLLFLLLAVLAPIAEETVFRAFLYRLLRTRLAPIPAAGVSAAAFALVHGVPLLMPWFFFMGFAFALVVEETRSIYSGIILHSMTNVLATLGIAAVLYNW